MPITSAPLPPFHFVLFRVSNTYGKLTMYQAKTVHALLFLSVFTAALDKARTLYYYALCTKLGAAAQRGQLLHCHTASK